MERQTNSTTTACGSQNRGSPFKDSSSFRLRSPCLNSLRLRRIFDLFDKNKDSIISAEELTQALNLLGLDARLCDLDSTLRSYIQPGQAGLTFQDFDALHRSLHDVFFGLQDQDDADSTSPPSSCKEEEEARQQEESDLSEAFKVFDEDGDGYISARELQVVLGKLGLQEEAREMDRVQMMISSVDLNHDGLVDFFEFKDMMRSIIVRSA
ncbi:calcium-binding protein CAST [Coffea eugenioides]|uniref:Calcium-binding protein CML42-like n=1 Tax=Coffea arabica TaxID=13443 RepID=A0ABM4USH9_COFAR|nr:calcium-binding protein CAST [Coffea arabica]XP_027173398.1 calcium-binding protein CAST [Coffea eugenioides]